MISKPILMQILSGSLIASLLFSSLSFPRNVCIGKQILLWILKGQGESFCPLECPWASLILSLLSHHGAAIQVLRLSPGTLLVSKRNEGKRYEFLSHLHCLCNRQVGLMEVRDFVCRPFWIIAVSTSALIKSLSNSYMPENSG